MPAVAYFHGLDFERTSRPWPTGTDLPFRAYLANSKFTAKRAERFLGVKPMVVPISDQNAIRSYRLGVSSHL